MSKPEVVVVDYGVGNLYSVSRAVEHCGGIPRLSLDPQQIAGADRLILPGVGAFHKGMEQLRSRALIPALHQFSLTGRPFLGICLGMQMMLSRGEEFGQHTGLNMIEGTVRQIPRTDQQGQPLKIPHIGWSALQGGPWPGGLLKGLDPGACVYFVHSYAAQPNDPHQVLASADYGGHALTAVIARGPWFGCQFHPERSGEVGLRIIENFLSL